MKIPKKLESFISFYWRLQIYLYAGGVKSHLVVRVLLVVLLLILVAMQMCFPGSGKSDAFF